MCKHDDKADLNNVQVARPVFLFPLFPVFPRRTFIVLMANSTHIFVAAPLLVFTYYHDRQPERSQRMFNKFTLIREEEKIEKQISAILRWLYE